MYDIPNSASEFARRECERQLESYKAKQAEKVTQQRHEENLQAQRDLIESNKQVAEEVRGIRDSLQEQIDDTRKELESTKLENKKLVRRSWIQLALTLGVSIISSAVALYFSIGK